VTQRVTDEHLIRWTRSNDSALNDVSADCQDARAEIAALRTKLEALRLVDTLARNSTDMTKIREAERAAYACGAIEEER